MSSDTAPLTVDMLREAVRTMPPDPRNQRDLWTTYALAVGVIGSTLGKEWVARHIGGRKANFLGAGSNWDETERNVHRVIFLADLIFNLQSVDQIESRLRILHGGIEAFIAELEFAWLLTLLDVPLRLVNPQNTKGTDFDYEVQTQNGTWIAAEVKCKIEGGKCTSEGIRRSMSKATSDNLPQDRACLIAVRVPPRPRDFPTGPAIRKQFPALPACFRKRKIRKGVPAASGFSALIIGP